MVLVDETRKVLDTSGLVENVERKKYVEGKCRKHDGGNKMKRFM